MFITVDMFSAHMPYGGGGDEDGEEDEKEDEDQDESVQENQGRAMKETRVVRNDGKTVKFQRAA